MVNLYKIDEIYIKFCSEQTKIRMQLYLRCQASQLRLAHLNLKKTEVVPGMGPGLSFTGNFYCMAAWLPNIKRSMGTKIPGLLYQNISLMVYVHYQTHTCHLPEILILTHLMSLLRNICLWFTNQHGQAAMKHAAYKDRDGVTKANSLDYACQCNKVSHRTQAIYCDILAA